MVATMLPPNAGLGVGVVADFELSAVGGQTAVESRRYTGAEVTTDACGSHQADLWLDFLEEVNQYGCMWVGCIGEEAFVGHFVNNVGAEGKNLIFHAVEFVAYNQCFEFYS